MLGYMGLEKARFGDAGLDSLAGGIVSVEEAALGKKELGNVLVPVRPSSTVDSDSMAAGSRFEAEEGLGEVGLELFVIRH